MGMSAEGKWEDLLWPREPTRWVDKWVLGSRPDSGARAYQVDTSNEALPEAKERKNHDKVQRKNNVKYTYTIVMRFLLHKTNTHVHVISSWSQQLLYTLVNKRMHL